MGENLNKNFKFSSKTTSQKVIRQFFRHFLTILFTLGIVSFIVI